VAALVAGILTTTALTMWDKPRAWVPILTGCAIGVLAYALTAPEA
jgi:hypothetical protein